MSNVWFCSDLHFGHENIHKFRKEFESERFHRDYVKLAWKCSITKRDRVFVLGDAAFTKEALEEFGKLPGEKILVRGNHDDLPTSEYSKYFSEIYGLFRYKSFWLSHAPIHPDELRGKLNLHGHVHYSTLPDKRYLNCCMENLVPLVGRPFISLDEVRGLIDENCFR